MRAVYSPRHLAPGPFGQGRSPRGRRRSHPGRGRRLDGLPADRLRGHGGILLGARVSETLRFHGITKRFGDGPVVLDGLDVEVPLTGLTFVIGKSGSGKSVLCRLAVGLLKPDRGSVTLLGAEVNELPER